MDRIDPILTKIHGSQVKKHLRLGKTILRCPATRDALKYWGYYAKSSAIYTTVQQWDNRVYKNAKQHYAVNHFVIYCYRYYIVENIEELPTKPTWYS